MCVIYIYIHMNRNRSLTLSHLPSLCYYICYTCGRARARTHTSIHIYIFIQDAATEGRARVGGTTSLRPYWAPREPPGSPSKQGPVPPPLNRHCRCRAVRRRARAWERVCGARKRGIVCVRVCMCVLVHACTCACACLCMCAYSQAYIQDSFKY